MLKIDPFLERNQVLFQGNDKHTTVTSFWSGRFMFLNSSASAIVPVGMAPLALPLASESERQATIRELMPYFLGYGKVEFRWASGTLEKYEDAMGWVIRWLGEIPPGRITQQHILLIKAQCAKRNVGPSKKSGQLVVIELKKNQTSDDTVGQLTRYMGWLEEHKTNGNLTKGIIIAAQYDNRLHYALKKVKDVEVYLYRVDFKLQEFAKPAK